MRNLKTEDAYKKLKDATTALGQAVDAPVDPNFIIRDGIIQRFEFTFELFWKYLKCLLEAKGVEARYPKDVLSEAYMGKLISDEKIWLEMLRDRNLTSHTYNQDLSEEIYTHIKTKYYPLIAQSLKNLENQ